MTPDETLITNALVGCSFSPGSSQKRLVRQLHGREKPLTERQATYLWAIAWSWRRQLSPSMVELARTYSAEVGMRGRIENEKRRVLALRAERPVFGVKR